MIRQKKISFVIITWNGLNYIKDLLISMENLMANPDYEIIVVDNGSEDDTIAYIKKKYSNILLIELPYNKGVAYARNRGMQVSKGDYIYIVDNDMLMKDEVVYGLYDFMERNTDVGICGCKLLSKDGSPMESCKKYPGFIYKLKRFLRIDKSGYAYKLEGKPFDVVYLIGACQFIRRDVFDQIGLLDEKIFYGPEDCDYCLRANQKGWRIVFLPQYSLIHYCQRMTNVRPFSKMGIRHIKGLLYLYWKYKKL